MTKFLLSDNKWEKKIKFDEIFEFTKAKRLSIDIRMMQLQHLKSEQSIVLYRWLIKLLTVLIMEFCETFFRLQIYKIDLVPKCNLLANARSLTKLTKLN